MTTDCRLAEVEILELHPASGFLNFDPRGIDGGKNERSFQLCRAPEGTDRRGGRRSWAVRRESRRHGRSAFERLPLFWKLQDLWLAGLDRVVDADQLRSLHRYRHGVPDQRPAGAHGVPHHAGAEGGLPAIAICPSRYHRGRPIDSDHLGHRRGGGYREPRAHPKGSWRCKPEDFSQTHMLGYIFCLRTLLFASWSGLYLVDSRPDLDTESGGNADAGRKTPPRRRTPDVALANESALSLQCLQHDPQRGQGNPGWSIW